MININLNKGSSIENHKWAAKSFTVYGYLVFLLNLIKDKYSIDWNNIDYFLGLVNGKWLKICNFFKFNCKIQPIISKLNQLT